MTNKPIKKKKPSEKLNNVPPEYDSAREQTVLLEEMNQSIKTIAEQHGSIVEKLDQHSKDLSIIKSELDTVKMATLDNSHRIKKLEQGQEKLEQGQEELKDGQQRIEQKLDIVTADHEQRITKLEAVR